MCVSVVKEKDKKDDVFQELKEYIVKTKTIQPKCHKRNDSHFPTFFKRERGREGEREKEK